MTKNQRVRADRLWQRIIDAMDDYAAREEASRTYTQYVLKVSPT
jgi:hypothetical protein